MKVGSQTYIFDNDVFIAQTATIAGPVEGEGCFGNFYDYVLENDEWGCKTHEQAEIKMHKEVIADLLEKAHLSESDIDGLMGGDLLNQIITTSFSAREFKIPFLGQYCACATFGECLALGGMLVSSGFFKKVLCATSSHYSTAERQYRYPLELGTQPTPTSQWTVTGAGCSLISNEGQNCPKLTAATLGKIIDLGITDTNNMGAAMAPAACDTIITHLKDTGRSPDYYDYIITGDLGIFGMEVLHDLCLSEGYQIDNLNDCGAMIYTHKQKKKIQGGSGAGCSSLVFNSYIYKEMLGGAFKRILLVPTGALLSKCSSLQGETIPAIAHAVAVEM